MSDQKPEFNELLDGNDQLTEKQQKIIIAAIETFAEKGFAASSTSEIAKKAGVAEGTIFRHYKTKKELLVSIVSPVMAKLIAPFVIKDLNKVLDQQYESFEDFIRAMIKNRSSFLKKNTTTLKIMLQEIPFHPELKELFKEHVADKIVSRIKVIIEHFQEKGEIIDIPADTIIRLAASAGAGYILTRYLIMPDADWDDEVEIEYTVQFIMNGIRKR